MTKPANTEIISTIAGVIFLCILAEIGTKAFVFGILFGLSIMIESITVTICTLKGE